MPSEVGGSSRACGAGGGARPPGRSSSFTSSEPPAPVTWAGGTAGTMAAAVAAGAVAVGAALRGCGGSRGRSRRGVAVILLVVILAISNSS